MTRSERRVYTKEGNRISHRRFSRIMEELELVSNYTVAQYKVPKKSTNEERLSNLVVRQFNNREYLEVVVSDLNYVGVAGRWNYVCLITDLHNREFIGYSAGPTKIPSWCIRPLPPSGRDFRRSRFSIQTGEMSFRTTPLMVCLKPSEFKGH